MSKTPIILWGAGEMGRRALLHFGEENVIAYIDGDKERIGTSYYGKRVLSFEEYKKYYEDYFILITPLDEQVIEEYLKRNNVITYFRLSDCPSEFSEVEESGILKNNMIRRVSGISNVAILGWNYYALVLADWFSSVKNEKIKIIVPEETENIFYELLKKRYPAFDFEKINECFLDKGSSLFISTKTCPIVKGKLSKSIKTIDAFDISYTEETYHNKEIERLKDIHAGEDCFIIGHGPSLNSKDLDVLEQNNVITFSMNLVYKLFDSTSWRPDYYVVSDKNMVPRYSYFKWEQYTKRMCFIADMVSSFWQGNVSTMNLRYHSIRNMPEGKPEFSDDISRKVCYGATVTYDCMQIAVYMGFKRIYLLGMDLSPYKPDQRGGIYYSNFFEQDEKSRRNKLWIDKIIAAYEEARNYTEKRGIHIYNASRGGYLEVFDRVDFDEMFSQVG